MSTDKAQDKIKKNNTAFPWGGWVDLVVPPSEQQQQGGGGNGDGDGDGDSNQQGNGKPQQSNGSGNDPGSSSGGHGQQPHSAYGSETEQSGDGDDYVSVEVKLDKKTWLVDEFDCLADMANAADRPTKWPSNIASRDPSLDPDWGGCSFAEAIHLAKAGWPEGLSKAEQIIDFYNRTNRWAVNAAIDMDVVGAYPIVPAYCAGDPVCMVLPGNVLSSVKPILHIIVNRCASGSVSSSSIYNFGAALMICIDQIETIGTRVELEICIPSRPNYDSHDKQPNFLVRTKLKRPQQSLDKGQLIYGLAHPAVLRRMEFSLLEQKADMYVGYGSGHGQVEEMPKQLIPNGAVYLPSVSGGANDIKKVVENLQKKLGIEVSSEGVLTMKTFQETKQQGV